MILTLAVWLAPPVIAAGTLTGPETRGKQIYFSGTSPSGGAITAYFGTTQQALPGPAATCGSCHGHDGTGRPESGLIPSNITWKYLVKSYGHIHAGGLAHGPFDEKTLKDYLRTGVYPGGGVGDPAMPLYTMPGQDMDNLVAFLKRLGQLPDPGVGEGFIRVGTLVPGDGPAAAAGRAIREVLAAYFSNLNEAGGIYGRKFELVVHEFSGARQAALERVENWLAEQQPFALVSTFTPDAEVAVQAAAAAGGIPSVGPFTLYPSEDFLRNRQVFYLLGGLSVQVRALIRYTAERLEPANPACALIYPKKKSLDEVIAAVALACKSQKWPAVQRRPFEPGAFDADETAGALEQAGVGLVVFLGVESQLSALLDACVRRHWMPLVLTPGVLAGRLVVTAPPDFARRLYLAYPTLPRDRKDWAVKKLGRLMSARDTGQQHPQAVISAYCAAGILTEAVRLAGRDLDRTKFADRLEKLYRFDTGLTPPITYTRNRRIGANGAYVVGFEPQRRGTERVPGPIEWVELN